MFRKAYYFVPLIIILLVGAIFYYNALSGGTLYSLPSVPCINPQVKITRVYTVNIQIYINNVKYPIDANIGHDPGNCIRQIQTIDSSGKVIVTSYKNSMFTLGDFFNTWHKNFSNNRIFNYQVNNDKTLKVYQNGKLVNTFEKTPLLPNESLRIEYN